MFIKNYFNPSSAGLQTFKKIVALLNRNQNQNYFFVI